MNKLSLEQGTFLVKLARKTIENFLQGKEMKKPTKYDKILDTKTGVFVTLNTYPAKELRGCIGHPLPTDPLINATIDSAISACSRDPRFEPLTKEELQNIIIEVTVLTPPELIKVNDPKEYPSKIKVGKDGLVAELGLNKGLLLPQVPVEWNWDAKEFLSHLCTKAGLPPDSWLDKNIKIYKFQGQIFTETQPSGKVKEKTQN